MKNLTWQNPEQLFVAQELINKVKSKCCGIKVKLLETFEYKPKKYAERVNHIFEVLGLSLFECYDMTEKLYKEVKKIATEINNFLNEGEFR